MKKHLFLVNLKIEELNIPNEKQAEFLKKHYTKTFFYELSSLNEFNEKKHVLSWVKESLLSMFSAKQSNVSLMANLFKTKQLHGKSLRDFLSSIRIETQKLFFDKSAKEKEAIMEMGFINGLSNSSFRKILSELKPKSLEEAYSLIKNEQIDEVKAISGLNATNFTPKRITLQLLG